MGFLQFALFAPSLIFIFWSGSLFLIKTSCRSQRLSQTVEAALRETVDLPSASFKRRPKDLCRRIGKPQVEFKLPTRLSYE